MKGIVASALVLSAACALAQEDAVVVTATRVPQPSLEIPASVDRVYADEIRAGPAAGQSLREPRPRAGHRGAEPAELRAGPADLLARLRRALDFRRARHPPDRRRHPGDDARRAGTGLDLRPRLGRAHRGAARALFGLYGNAAGGVIASITEDAPQAPTGEASLFAGSFDTWQGGAKVRRPSGALGEISRFDTDGYREHSAARRDQLNAKLRINDLTIVANSLRQPDSQDPGGLTRAQFEANPRQASPTAEPFDTRKTVNQDQAGLRFQHRLGGSSSLEATAYVGQREVRQFLGFAGDFGLSSGGVVDLDRNYGGEALRLFLNPNDLWRLSFGAEHERMDERRRGFVNDNGIAGALRRDEDDVVDSTDLFAQAEWRFAERWSAHGGLRASRVEFRATDYFIGGANPDDSGARSYSATTPVAGLVFRPTKLVSVYGNIGRGFETPTFAELAHQNTGSGLNFALQPAKSRHAEIGAKAVFSKLARVNAALFDIEVTDEIVVDVNAGGRTTFKNAGRTERRGLELAAETLLAGPWDAQLAFTRLDAVLEDSGNLLPGVPRTQAYGSVRYRRDSYYAQLEAVRRSRVAVNDANAQFADAYTVASVVAGLVQRGERWRVTEFVRIDNLADRNYAGSVIVNEGSSRFYEPAPGRNYLLGVQAALQF